MRDLPELESNGGKSESIVAPLAEFISENDLSKKWMQGCRILEEAMRQDHLVSPLSLSDVDPADERWQRVASGGGCLQYKSEDDVLYLSGDASHLIGRRKSVDDEFGRLVECQEVVYGNNNSRPLATDDPLDIEVYKAEYGLPSTELDIVKLFYSHYERDTGVKELATYWVQPPFWIIDSLDHISLAKAWTYREIYLKYIEDNPYSAYILEHESVPSPHPEAGSGFVLMRSIRGVFEEAMLASIDIFDRREPSRQRTQISLTRDGSGGFKQVVGTPDRKQDRR